MFKVTRYCYDRNEVVFEDTFKTWRGAFNCFMRLAKAININESIDIKEAD